MDAHDRRRSALQAVEAARRIARRGVLGVAVRNGSQVVSTPTFPGALTQSKDAEPMAGLWAAYELELAARQVARRYVRDAREAGRSWHEIGMTLDVQVRREAERAGRSGGELAYQYAIGRDGDDPSRYDSSFPWKCQSCDMLIIDRGPFASPASSEPGHTDNCERLAAAEAAWEADWEAAD